VPFDDQPGVERELLSIIRIAEWLANSTDWKAANRRQDELLEKWKVVSRRLRGRRRGEELWKRFSTARQRYYHRRKVHFAEVERNRGRAHPGKQRRDHAHSCLAMRKLAPRYLSVRSWSKASEGAGVIPVPALSAEGRPRP
jgi:hypothetical protein